jgi:hypothetical protein
VYRKAHLCAGCYDKGQVEAKFVQQEAAHHCTATPAEGQQAVQAVPPAPRLLQVRVPKDESTPNCIIF